MKRSITTRYAIRSLLRHRQRTLLAAVGIGIGCAVCLFMVSFARGEGEMIKRAAAYSGTGHLRICPKEWLASRENYFRLNGWEEMLRVVRRTEHVAAAAPHARIEALLAIGTRTTGVIMVGVDPEAEPKLNRLVQNVQEGRYLRPGETGKVVIGRAVADRLDVEVGDPLMVTVSGEDGDMKSAMLEVTGIVATGSRELDSSICQVLLADVAQISGYPGAAEISILLEHPKWTEAVSSELLTRLDDHLAVVTWEAIVPELASGAKVDRTWSVLTVGVVILVVFLGIASAQLAAVLERRREFAVLSAVGMSGSRLVGVMLAEGMILGLLGTLLALLLGGPAVYLLSRYGIDFGKIYGDVDLGVSNILMDPIIYGDIGWWVPALALVLALGATMLSSLYPAWYARRTDPAEALRVD